MTENLTAIGCYVYAGGFSVGVRRAGFNVLAHLEGDDAYGVSSAKLNWPDLDVRHGPSRWALDSFREPRVDFIYCNPPCFSGDTQVITESGTRAIKDLVRERSTEKVLSIDAAGKRVFRAITGWHENPYAGDLYDVSLPGRKRRARATAEHRFMTRRGWVEAVNLHEDDEVCVGSECPNERQHELITGLMLGDSQIKKHQAQLYVFQTTPDYVELKRRALASFVSQEIHEENGTACGEFTRKPRHGFYLKTQRWVEVERDRWYASDRTRKVPRDIVLTPLALAVWYMDDGTLRGLSSAKKVTPKRPNGSLGGIAQLCTDRLPHAEVDFLIEKLNELGIEARLAGRGNSERDVKFPRILIPTAGFRRFIELIGSYVPPELRYKLPDWAPAFDPSLWELGEPDVHWSRVEVQRVPRKFKNRTKVFCLDIEETHNFVTYGGVVHNCALFSSQGIVTTRGADSWRDDPRLEHWYDCVRGLETANPRAWCLESVTQAYSRGRPVIDEITKRALVRGFSVSHVLLDAKWHGIPQSRKRFFVVAHGPSKLGGYAPTRNWAPPPTVGETLEAVANSGWSWDLQAHLQHLLDHTEPGGLLCDTFDRITPEESKVRHQRGVIGRPSFRHKRLDGSTQMGAYIAGDFYHPTENRVIGINESKALCGYPEDFKLAPPEREGPHLLARAVMPPVGEWLARAVAATLTQPDGRWEDRTVTRIDVREPGREPVDLTGEYLDDGGRVRLRVRSNGHVTWSGFSAPSRGTERPLPPPVPKPPAEPIRVLAGLPQPQIERERGETPAPAASEPAPLAELVPQQGEGSGRFMQRLWRETTLSPEEILAAVHASYAGRTTARGDVYYNYKKLVDAGEAVRPWPGRSRATDPVSVTPRAPTVSAEGGVVPTPPSVRPSSLAVRSTVVPERSGHVRRVLLYFSKLAERDAATPLSSARIAWFLQDEVEFDAVFHAGAYSAEMVPAEIDELWVVNSSWMWNTDEWRRVCMRYFDAARKVVFCQNDYALILNSYHLGTIQPHATYAVLSTAPETSYMRKHGVEPALVNWNVLTYQPRPETDAERQPGVYYYGSNRSGRSKVFARYFADAPVSLTVSASNGEDAKTLKALYPGLNIVGRADDVYSELERWAATLVLEDERALTTYVSPPNRFYEALSSRCPMLFDRGSIPMFARYGYDISSSAVSGPGDLDRLISDQDRLAEIAELQTGWQRDYVAELRDQLAEARQRLDRGELGRRGAPEHLKRYVLRENGGEF